MDSFLASLKNESREYTNTAVAIDEIQREFSVRFEELEDQAILKVKNIKRPMTVMQKSRFAKEVKVRPRSAKSELAKAKLKNQEKRPNTARNFSRGNNFDIDYRRKPKKTSQNPKIWVTDEYPLTTRGVDSNTAINIANFPNVYFSNTDNNDNYDNNNNNQTYCRKISNSTLQVSSHHFDNDQFENPIKTARRPKTNKKWTSPLCVRRIERKLTDDERLFDEPAVENMVL